jgi:hypothetical protein
MNCPKCQHDIATHPANSCLDAVFAEKVMGCPIKEFVDEIELSNWQEYPFLLMPHCTLFRKGGRHPGEHWSPSTNISHAMEGVEIAKTNNWYFQIHNAAFDNRWKVNLWLTGHLEKEPIINYAETAPLAITRALILWAMEKVK